MDDKDDDRLLSGQEAAEFLGVKSQTLYAYASRGLIESQPAKSARQRAYRLSDLIRLRQAARGYKSSRESDAAVWTGPVIKSAITDIQNDGHYYRGQSALELAGAGVSFESVAELVWDSGAGPELWAEIEPLPFAGPARKILSQDSDYLSVLKLILVTAEMNDPVSRRLLREDRFETARRLIACMSGAASFAGGSSEYSGRKSLPVASSLLASLGHKPDEKQAQTLNTALVLCADHELNASALSARIAASCDASLYSCLLSALGSFSGSLHGSASRRAEDIVLSSFRFASTKAWLRDYLQQYESIPGFGTELYKSGDPRAKFLIEKALELPPANANVNRLVEIVDCVREHFGAEPNLDVGLAAVSFALCLPPGSGSIIFAVSRSAGWIAHAVEQREYGGSIRPRAKYIGKA